LINELKMHAMAIQGSAAIGKAVAKKGSSSTLAHQLRLPRNLDTGSRTASAIRDGLVLLLLLVIAATVIHYCSKRSRRVSLVDEESLQEKDEREWALPGPHIDANTRMHDTRTFYGWVKASNTAARAEEGSERQQPQR
jgi:hypothetical protein